MNILPLNYIGLPWTHFCNFKKMQNHSVADIQKFKLNSSIFWTIWYVQAMQFIQHKNLVIFLYCIWLLRGTFCIQDTTTHCIWSAASEKDQNSQECKVTWLVCWLKICGCGVFHSPYQIYWYQRVKFNVFLQNEEDNKTQSVLKDKSCRVNSISISLFQFMTLAFIHLHVLQVICNTLKVSRTDLIELNH